MTRDADKMSAVVTRCSSDFRYVWVTRNYADWVGRPPEEIAGRVLADVIGSQGYETIRPYIERVLSGRRVEYTTRLNLQGRGYRWIHAVYEPIYSRGLDADGWISMVTDVTESKRVDQLESVRAGRALSMSKVAPPIAHEVNQPLTAVVTNAEAGLQWLSGETPNVQEAKESLAMIVRDGNRASAIIRSIREFLKNERAETAPLDINEVIGEAVAPARAEFLKRGIALRIDSSEALPTVWADRVQLQQVILNLAMNGAEAMDSSDGLREVLVTSRRTADDGVEVAVRDSGAGVHPKDLQRIFDPFFTTKDTGMGMGLSICRSIIEALGGRIRAELNEGPGLTVQFSIPGAAARKDGLRSKSDLTPNRVLRRKPPGAVNRATQTPQGKPSKAPRYLSTRRAH
jgi:PAS domain S-box-containing protein